jgi:GGDEF domain-containing protein
MLAALAVFLAEYLRKPAGRTHAFDVLDASTGLNNEAFFNVRFDQELSRCRRTGSRFTVVMAHVERPPELGEHSPAHPRDVQLVAELIAMSARPEDVLAHVGDGAIMALLPDTSQTQAEQITAMWRRQLWPMTDGTPPPSSPFVLRIGLCQYGQPALSGDGPQQLANRN